MCLFQTHSKSLANLEKVYKKHHQAVGKNRLALQGQLSTPSDKLPGYLSHLDFNLDFMVLWDWSL